MEDVPDKNTMTEIKIFMASPNDTKEERKIFIDVIESLNRARGDQEGFYLRAIKWEDYAYPEAENPQS
ncbi:MAG TPA: hypothetical protein DHW81_07195, partial [Nitrospiraceae bacterium]|nr:hypothetical protein [Nitrospiraceae bacterium]